MLQSLLPGAAETVLATAASWLLTYLAASTVVLGSVWILDGRTRWTRGPAARTEAWTAAALVPVLAVLLQAATGLGPRVGLQASEAEKVVAEFGTEPAAAATPAGSAAGAAAASGASRAAGGSPPASSAGPVLRAPHRADRMDPRMWVRTLGHDWPFLLALAWATGAGALVLLQLAGWGGLAWRLRGRAAIEDGPRRDDLDDLLERAGADLPVRLSRSDAVAGPVALPGGEICLPGPSGPDLDREQQRAVLAHELAHVRRGDTVRLLLLRLLERLLFLQPLNRLAFRRVEAACEDVSDEWVRRQGMGRTLAGTLVTVARWMRTRPRPPDLAGLARTPAVERRIRRLLEPVGRSGTEPATGHRAAPALGLLVLLLLAAPAAEIGTPAHASMLADGPREAEPGWVEKEVVRGQEAPDARAGGSLVVRLDGADGPVSVALRPGGGRVRLVGPGGRTATVDPPADGRATGWGATLRVPGARPGRWELHLPASVRRLDLAVDGRRPRTAGPLAGGELPRMVGLR